MELVSITYQLRARKIYNLAKEIYEKNNLPDMKTIDQFFALSKDFY